MAKWISAVQYEVSEDWIWAFIPPGGERLLGLIFAGYVPLASQNPYPIIAYSVARYRPHLGHFSENVIFTIPT